MFYCKHCSSEFETPRILITEEGNFDVCPDCRSENFVEMFQCEICREEYIRRKHESYNICCACWYETMRKLNDFLKSLNSDEEVFLREYIDVEEVRNG